MKLFRYILSLVCLVCFSHSLLAQRFISLMGAPAAGKGTLAGKCVKELGSMSLSVGNLLREEIARGTGLGKEVSCIMQGRLASDELVVSVVKAWLDRNFNDIDILILDGFPRTANQAELFVELMHERYHDVSVQVVNLRVTDETAIRRIENRLICEGCQEPTVRTDRTELLCEFCGGKLIKRADDTEEIMLGRLEIYAKHKEALCGAYDKEKVKVNHIDVENKTPQEIFEEFKEIVGI